MQAGAEALLKFDLGIYRQIPAATVVDKVKDADIVIFWVVFHRIWKEKKNIL